MNNNKSEKIRILSILVLLIQCIVANGSDAVDLFIKNKCIDSSSTAVVVIDLKDGNTIESYNAEAQLLPASLMKTVTIASLLNKTGIDYTYHTKIYSTGEISDGILRGNLLIVGSGDPSLNAASGPESPDIIRECVDSLHKLGVRQINGDIKVDASIFPLPATPSSWSKEDMKKSYGAGCFGLNFCNNSNGSASCSNPSAKLIAQLKDACRGDSIEVLEQKYSSTNRHTLIVDHHSANIDEIMRSCMMRSDNLYAEALLRTYALNSDRVASPDAGADLEMNYWKNIGLSTDKIRIIDGSGLSRKNVMTASFLANMLAKMAGDVDYVSFFPLAGQDGTLRKFLKDTPLDSYIALKTGSMRGVQCYAGYKLDDDYAPTHIVVIMINNFKSSRSAVKENCEQMLLKIFSDI